MTDNIGLDYVEIETKLLGSIWPSAFYDENQTGLRWLVASMMIVQVQSTWKEYWTLWSIESSVNYDENHIGKLHD